MWNFGIPYKLKHLIDVVTQPGLTFGVDPATHSYFGPDAREVGGRDQRSRRRVRSRYGPPPRWTAEAPYVEQWLKFIGVGQVTHVYVEPTLGGEAAATQARDRAIAQAREVAAK